jgi:hypothetical protein
MGPRVEKMRQVAISKNEQNLKLNKSNLGKLSLTNKLSRFKHSSRTLPKIQEQPS